MKTLTIILACLLSSSVMAQKAKPSDIISEHPTLFNTGDSIIASKIWTHVGHIYSPFQTINMPASKIESWIITGGDGKEAMKIVLPDSLGIVRGYINKKKIVWTSDSTFTIKTK